MPIGEGAPEQGQATQAAKTATTVEASTVSPSEPQRDSGGRGILQRLMKPDQWQRFQEGRNLSKNAEQRRKNEAREKERVALLDQRVTVQLPEGVSRENLSAEAQEHLRMAQEELVRLQEEQEPRTNFDAIKALSAPEQRQVLGHLRAESRIVVSDDGNSFTLIQGDERGYKVESDGKLTLRTYNEPVKVQSQDPEQTTVAELEERSAHLGLARVTFGKQELNTREGRTVTIQEATILHGNTEGGPISQDRELESKDTNVFSGIGSSMVDISLSRVSVPDSQLDVFVVDVGKTDGSHNNAVQARVYESIAKVLRGDANVENKRLLIAGLGADALKISGSESGSLAINGVDAKWQIKGFPKEGEAVRGEQRHVVHLALSAVEMKWFDQLSHEQQVALLARQSGVLPDAINQSRVDFDIKNADTAKVPESAVRLNSDNQKRLQLDAALALARTNKILQGQMSANELSDMEDPSELVLVIKRSSYTDPITAMKDANTFIANIRAHVDKESSKPDNKKTRQTLAREFVSTHASGNRDRQQEEAVDRLVEEIGSRTERELVRDIIKAKRREGVTPEDFRNGLADQLGSADAFADLSEERRRAMVDTLRGNDGYSPEELMTSLLADLGEDTLTDEKVRTLQQRLNEAKKRGTNVGNVQKLLDRVSEAFIEVTPEQVQKVIGEAVLGDDIANHRDEISALIARLPEGDEKERMMNMFNERFPAQNVSSAERTVNAINEFKSGGREGETRDDAYKRMVPILASVPEEERETIADVLSHYLPSAPIRQADRGVDRYSDDEIADAVATAMKKIAGGGSSNVE